MTSSHLVLMTVGAWLLTVSVQPAAAQIASPTNTPLPDGRIVYIVQEGDSPWSIAASSGLSLDEFLSLNNMNRDVILSIGQKVLLRKSTTAGASPAAVTATPEPATTVAVTALPAAATAIPSEGSPVAPGSSGATTQPGMGEVCVLAFVDTNADGRRQATEGPLGGVQFAISRNGQGQGTYQTEPKPQTYCFGHLGPGTYQVQGVLPDGVTATTPTQIAASVQDGEMPVFELGGIGRLPAVPILPVAGETPVENSIGLLVGIGIAGLALVGLLVLAVRRSMGRQL